MTTEPNKPVLLTEAQWHEYYADVGVGWAITCKIIEGHRERSLIAPEPDPLRDAVITANRAAMHELHFTDTDAEPAWLAAFVKHLRALGVELEREKRPVVTEEIVRRAFAATMPVNLCTEDRVRLAAALQEQLK